MSIYIHPTAVVDDGAIIGDGTKIWHFCHVMGGARIGKNCILGQNVFVGGKAVIGDGVKIQNNVSVYDGVTIEDDVFLGPSCVFTNVMNPRAFVDRKAEYRNTLVAKGATIGAGAKILCGVVIGQYAFVAMGAVVTRDVGDNWLVMGVPARYCGYVNDDGTRRGKWQGIPMGPVREVEGVDVARANSN